MVKKIKKEFSKSIQTMAKVNLPSDIMESNILTRLPAKTLIRFRAVGKSWYSLLSDPFFINMHYQFQFQKKNNHLFLVEDRFLKQIMIINSSWKEYYSSFNYIYTSKTYLEVKVVGCFNGIVCVLGTPKNPPPFNNTACGRHFKDHIILWNPALRINKIVGGYRLTRQCHRITLCLGFSYHNQTNDYKVIGFRYIDYSVGPEIVEIYSSNSDSWRKIKIGGNDRELIKKCTFSHKFGVYVSCCRGGAYFWVATKQIQSYISEDRIISFNIEDEVFKEMMLPYTNGWGNTRTHAHALFIYKDSSLAVFQRETDFTIKPSYTIIYIWVMKELNSPTTWTKLCKFDLERPRVSSILGIAKNQVFLIVLSDFGKWPRKEEMNVFDIDKSEMSSFTKDIFCLTRDLGVTSYNESLISIF